MIVAALRNISLATLFVAGSALLAVLALDALEWETTGACKDCVLLPYTAERFQ